MSFELPFKLPTGWQVATVDELVKQKVIAKPLDGNHGGIHPKASDYIESGVPFVMASDLIGGRVDLIDCKFISEEQASGLRKGVAKAGDVLLSHKATIGRTAIVQDSEHDFIMLTPQVTYYRVINTHALSNVYLKAYFDSRFFQSILGLWAGAGSTRAYLGITGQLKLPIILPPIEIQNEISAQVHALNKKVNLNNEINQTLEQMAQAIFKSWFVDFDPVKAKMNGEQPEGMDAATASLFPEKLVESELGLIPEGWDAVKVGDIVQRLKPKKRYTKKQVEPYGKTPVYEQGASILLGFHNDDAGFDASPEDPVFIFGDHTCITHLSCSKFDISSNVIPLKGSVRPTIWTYYAIQGKQEFQEYRRHWSEFIIKDVVLPPVELAEKYAELVTTKYLMMESLKRQSKELEQLRDTLLPKLLSGEIELGATEALELEA